MPCRPALLTSLAVATALSVAAVALAVPAVAAGPPGPRGAATSAQDTFHHRLRISGWAVDGARPAASVTVRIYADGDYVGQAVADRASATVDRAEHVTGNHAFTLTITRVPTVRTVVIRSSGASASAPLQVLGSSRTSHFEPAAGARIVSLARKYVGKARYVEGGASPRTGFDCSGYVAYVYSTAGVARLPHIAEEQRHVRGMRHISARAAKPGDLVFYLSAGSAYHVAIYAGHGMQYAAATPRDGVRYQKVWSTAVEYRHYTP